LLVYSSSNSSVPLAPDALRMASGEPTPCAIDAAAALSDRRRAGPRAYSFQELDA